jgi:hypothetical protein
MPDRSFSTNADVPAVSPNWGAIWAGTFAFIAIWSVFGFLGAAIFNSLANPNASNLLSSMGVGIGIWAVILTIVAMFIGGRVTARLAGRIDAIINGTVMFGLSVTSALVIAVLSELALGRLTTAAGNVMSTSVGLSWIGFVALILGWVAAIGGALSLGRRRATETTTEQVRRATAA